ncbi:hypothetical protein HZC53_02940 [Candidatus Uhrbacteria bacterium]|nr:hypothetical protein [Candidatus Uhrbacteria bacterium]
MSERPPDGNPKIGDSAKVQGWNDFQSFAKTHVNVLLDQEDWKQSGLPDAYGIRSVGPEDRWLIYCHEFEGKRLLGFKLFSATGELLDFAERPTEDKGIPLVEGMEVRPAKPSARVLPETQPFSGPPSEEDIQEKPLSRETVERLILEVLLIQHADRINEGNNGIIFSLRINELSKEALDVLIKLGILSPEEDVDRVVKLLKIGSPGKLKKEYDLCAKACSTVKRKVAEDPSAFADIPQPRYYDSLKITPFFQQTFMTQHDVQLSGGEIEIMVMDKVEGTDVDTLLLREFLRRNPNSPFLKQPKKVDVLSFEDLEGTAMSSLGFKRLTGKRRSQWSDDDWKEYVRFRKDMEGFLHNTDFRIDMSLFDAVERSIHAIYDEAGVAWGDGNLRNIMLEGPHGLDEGGSLKGKAWLIDFGGAEFGPQAADPAKMRQQVLAAVGRLKNLFGLERRRPAAQEDLAKKITAERKARYVKADKLTVRLADQFTSDLKSRDSLPLNLVVHRVITSGRQHYEAIDRVLHHLAQSDPAAKQKVIASLLSWLTDKEELAYMEKVNVSLRQNLEGLLDDLQHS